MIICPKCGNPMICRKGNGIRGYYEFYGCSTYPKCTQTVEVDDAQKYDNGEKNNLHNVTDRTIKEEAQDLRDVLMTEGWSFSDADHARYMWEKDK